MGKLNKSLLRVAFLHFAPRYDDVAYNIQLLESMFHQAIALQADLVLTPELAVSGYEFFPVLGKEWIRWEGQSILEKFRRLALENQVALALGCPTYDEASDTYHNSAIVIDGTGQISGSHHKILVLPGSIEGWSAAGQVAQPVEWHGQKLGMLICADAYSQRLGTELAQRGAQVFISLAAWAPGEHGPSGEWEMRSQEANLTMLVCNRTGQGASLNFEGSSSVVVVGGRRVAEYTGKSPAILTMDFDEGWQPQSPNFSLHALGSETWQMGL